MTEILPPLFVKAIFSTALLNNTPSERSIKLEQNNMLQAETKEEKVTHSLRNLFFKYGYRRYEMSNFESYDMYVNHKGFLNNSNIITFTDTQGKLKALKPDVTMSIVKNTKETDKVNKLYYIESVFRAMPHGEGIKEIKQMGIEFIGCNDIYCEAEVIELATQSLCAISENYILDVSHMGFVTGLLNTIKTTQDIKNSMREAIRTKSAHELIEQAQKAKCNETQINMLTELVSLSGGFTNILKRAKKLACNEEMLTAINVLTDIYNTLKQTCDTDKLRLDFSITSDVDYYNGIMLHGYIKNVPSAVLVGGRYDNLMRNFNKPQCALGFAVHLGELGRAFPTSAKYDVDTLVLYDDAADAEFVMQEVKKMRKQQNSVFATSISQNPKNIRAKKTVHINYKCEVNQC